MSNLQLALPGVLPGESPGEWVWHEEPDVNEQRRFEHATVMRDEAVRAVAPRPGGTYVDVTLGAGGHTIALLEAEPRASVVGLDRDPDAVQAARERIGPVADRVRLVHAPFSRLRAELDALGVGRVDGVVADLGVSSPQIDRAERGMSFRQAGPIDMRMDPTAGETALELIERLSDDALADVIYQFGDERRSRRIARSLRRALADGELKTTIDLRRAIVRAVGPARVGGVDPATRTFQALRIAVNGELDELGALLSALRGTLVHGGVAVILSFHSLEDRLVKRAFAGPGWTRLTKKPVQASEEEAEQNPRARSAKLRAARFELDEVER